jgi:hypothetical protein
MEFNPHHFQNIKLALHIAQLVIIFVAWAMMIAVFTSSASIDGRAGWYFGLVRAVHLSLVICTFATCLLSTQIPTLRPWLIL